MAITIVRAIAVFTALIFASVSVGCEREVGDDEVYMGEPGGDEAAEEELLGESQEFDEQRLKEVRVEVSDELGVPSDVVVIDQDIRRHFDQETTDTELRAWATVSTVEDYLTRLNVDALEQGEREAALELQQQVVEVEQKLMELQREDEPQAPLTETNLEDQLTEIGDNWEQIADRVQPAEQPVGGGPVDDSQGPDEQPR